MWQGKPNIFKVKIQYLDEFCTFQAFAHRLLLEKHISHACSSEEWICPICAKVFSCRDKLRFHLATHCEHKPYVCRYCPYRY